MWNLDVPDRKTHSIHRSISEHEFRFGFQVVSEVKELVKEGESEAAAVGGAISNAVAEFPGAASRNIPSVSTPDGGLSPALQAGVVAGAGVVGVLVASAVVNTLVSPSK